MVRDEYVRNATVEDVVDGDTIRVSVDLGFRTWRHETVRLLGSKSGVNTYEMHDHDPAKRKLAEAGKERTAGLLPIGCKVTIITELDHSNESKTDGFQRYLAQVIAPTGENIGDTLLAEGLAVVYHRA